MTCMVFLMDSVVSDLGRSREKPKALEVCVHVSAYENVHLLVMRHMLQHAFHREMVSMGSTPIARPTPNMTV